MMDLNITYADIEKTLRNWTNGLSDVSSDIDEMIEDETLILEPTIVHQGYDPYDVTPSGPHPRLYRTCRRIVVLRVSAELLEQFSHETGKLAADRRKRADELEARIHAMPVGMSDEWNGDNQRGSWDFDKDDDQWLQDRDNGVFTNGFLSIERRVNRRF